MVTKRKILKKHASTIHCTNNLTLASRKISNVLLYHAYSDLAKKDEHEISISHLIKLLGISTNNIDAIKDALKQLVSSVIEWNVLNHNTGSEDWSATSILASVNIHNGICKYSYSPRMKALLYEPSVYGKVNLLIQTRFKSNYGLALYENCSRFRNIKQTKEFTVDEFRKIMGVAQSQYNIFRDFKKRVLDKAVDEVNTCSDLLVEYELFRLGRKVSKIKFFITEKNVKPKFLTSENKEIENNRESQFIDKLVNEFNLSRAVAVEIESNYSVDFINEKIDLIKKSKSFNSGLIDDVGAYLVTALKKDFKPSKTSTILVNENANSAQESFLAKARKREAEEKKQRDYQLFKRNEFFNTIRVFKKYDDYINEWLVNLSSEKNFNNKRIKRLYKESDFQHAQVALSFMNFFKENYPESYPSIPSYEEYLKDNHLVRID